MVVIRRHGRAGPNVEGARRDRACAVRPAAVDLAAATLTVALVRLGVVEAARALGRDTLQRCRRVLGPDHPITLYLARVAVTDHPSLGDDAAADDPRPPR